MWKIDHIQPKVQSKSDIITDIFLEEGIIDFYKLYLIYIIGNMEGGLLRKRWNMSGRCTFMGYSRETEASWCHSHKVTQYMHQPAS